jgi:hypothetical protein
VVLGCISTLRFLMAHDVDAQVAELVDALASGASGRKVVEVRVFSWAPFSAASQPTFTVLMQQLCAALAPEALNLFTTLTGTKLKFPT